MTALALDSSYWSSLADGVGAILLYAVVGLVLMVIGFYGIDLTTPGGCGRWWRRAGPMPSR